MAEIVAIEPSLFRPDTEAWFIFDDGRKCLRKLETGSRDAARSDFPCPVIRSDKIDPCLGLDGRMYESLSGYRRTLKAENNPQGENYIELGNESLKHAPKQFSKQERRDAIKQVGREAGIL